MAKELTDVPDGVISSPLFNEKGVTVWETNGRLSIAIGQARLSRLVIVHSDIESALVDSVLVHRVTIAHNSVNDLASVLSNFVVMANVHGNVVLNDWDEPVATAHPSPWR